VKLPARSFRSRLFLILVVAFGVLVSITAMAWRLTVEPALRLGVARHQLEVARRAADQIGGFIDDRIARLAEASDLGQLWRADRPRQREVLARLLRYDQALQEVSLTDQTGLERVRLSRTRVVTDTDLGSVEMQPAFREAMTGRVYLGEVYHAATAEPMVTLALPIKLTPREFAGVLVAEINLKTLWNSISHIQVGRSGYGFIVDRRGTLIAHPDYSKVLLQTTMAEHPRVKPFLEGARMGRTLGEVVLDATGTPLISTLAVVEQPRWAVVVEEPVATALAEVYRLERFALFLILGAVAGAFGISYWFSRRIARPVGELRRGVERIARGDLDHRLAVATGDEIQDLAERFNEMAERLRLSNRQISETLATLQRTLRVRSACNAALVRSTDETQFLEAICRIIVEVGGYRTAWVGRAEHDPEKTVSPVARAGDDGYVEEAQVTWADAARGRGSTGTAIRTGEPCIIRLADPAFAPWREEAARRGYAASLGLPLTVDGARYGALGILSADPDAFDTAEVELLRSLAEDVAYGISALRARAERGAAQIGLERSERRFRNLIEHSAEAITLLGRDGAIAYSSPSTRRLLGYAPAELVGRHAADFVHPADAGTLAAAAGELIAYPERVRHHTLRLRHADGTWRWVETVGNNLLAEPDVGAIVVNWWDITERVEGDQDRRRLEEQLRQSQKMEAIGRLAGGIAHDFNNLLTIITGRSEVLLELLDPGTPGHRHAALVQQTAERAGALTSQLLAFSRKQVLRPEVIDVNARLSAMALMLQRLLGEDILLAFEPDPKIGRIIVDPSQLEQVIVNLAVNARDAMPEGGRLVLRTGREAEVADPGPRRYVIVEMTDSGVGMDEAVRSRIFEPFFTTKGPGKGTGLGLATVYGIVSQSGGDIRVVSAPGQGATFTIRFPEVAPEAAAAAARPPVEETLTGTETILLVEDEEGVRVLARDVLARRGYTVLEASAPEEAIAIAATETGPIHLLLTDVIMPQMRGDKLQERLRSTRPEMTVLYMSGYPDDSLSDHGVLMPGTLLLSKPFTPRELLRKVREALGAAPPA
jgi:PAS domain S-box-containing protein